MVGYLITDLDGDVILSLSNKYIDVGQVDGLLALDDGPHRVLEELEEDVLEVRRRVHDLHGRAVSQEIVDLEAKTEVKILIMSSCLDAVNILSTN